MDILTKYINYNAAIERCCFEKKVVGDNENWECKVCGKNDFRNNPSTTSNIRRHIVNKH